MDHYVHYFSNYCMHHMCAPVARGSFQLEEGGYLKKREIGFYEKKYIFVVKNANFATVHKELLAAPKAKIPTVQVDPTQPNCLVFRANLWTAKFSLLENHQDEYLYLFYFSQITKNRNTTMIEDTGRMSATLAMVENVLYKLDPNLQLIKK